VRITHSRFTNNLGMEGGGLNVAGGTVIITQSTFAGNSADFGGGMQLTAPAVVTLVDTTVEDNSTGQAGGVIDNRGLLLITNSTVSHNNSHIFGGGIVAFGISTTVILNSTITDNTTEELPTGGGGIFVFGGTMTVQNTILARNSRECAGASDTSVTSLGTNLIGDPTGCTITLQPSDLTGDPGLDAFTDNGTPGNGHFPLLPGSPAINAGNNAVCPRTDQLGRRRIGPCDIGAIAFRDQDDRQHEENPVATAQEPQ
jgi:hypothetical protein